MLERTSKPEVVLTFPFFYLVFNTFLYCLAGQDIATAWCAFFFKKNIAKSISSLVPKGGHK